MGFLRMIGAISAEEHAKAIKAARDEEAATIADLTTKLTAANRRAVDAEAKFKKAVTDIAGLTDDVRAAEKVADARARKIAELNNEIAAMKPDAEAMRAKRKRDRELKAAKAEAALNKAAISNAAAAGLKVVASDKPAAKAQAKKGARK